MRSTASATLLLVSDLHSGNENAVCSKDVWENFKKKSRRKIASQLEDGWYNKIDTLSNKHPDLCLANGDIIDGNNSKDMGMEVWTTKEQEQIDEAVHLIKQLKYQNILVTTGSGYHSKRNAYEFEEPVAAALARFESDGRISDYIRNYINGQGSFSRIEGTTHVRNKFYRYSDYKWAFRVFGVQVSLTHHVGHSAVEFYRSTPLARELVTQELDSYKGLTRDDDRCALLSLRSHCHYYCHLEFSNSEGVISPAWKMPDQYLIRKGLGGTLPAIGFVEIIIEQNGEVSVKKKLLRGFEYPKEDIPDISHFFVGEKPRRKRQPVPLPMTRGKKQEMLQVLANGKKKG